MINITKQGDRVTTYLTDFVIDSESELENLPIFPNVAKGSICLCIENGFLYILDGSNKWKSLEIKNEVDKVYGETIIIGIGNDIDMIIAGQTESESD